MMGQLKDAEGEFQSVMRQSKGGIVEAAYNLNLCRSLLATTTRSQLASLRMIETPAPMIYSR
jgi:hypothetical protein